VLRAVAGEQALVNRQKASAEGRVFPWAA